MTFEVIDMEIYSILVNGELMVFYVHESSLPKTQRLLKHVNTYLTPNLDKD